VLKHCVCFKHKTYHSVSPDKKAIQIRKLPDRILQQLCEAEQRKQCNRAKFGHSTRIDVPYYQFWTCNSQIHSTQMHTAVIKQSARRGKHATCFFADSRYNSNTARRVIRRSTKISVAIHVWWHLNPLRSTKISVAIHVWWHLNTAGTWLPNPRHCAAVINSRTAQKSAATASTGQKLNLPEQHLQSVGCHNQRRHHSSSRERAIHLSLTSTATRRGRPTPQPSNPRLDHAQQHSNTFADAGPRAPCAARSPTLYCPSMYRTHTASPAHHD
jgi:hypothetical protein